MAKAPRGQEKEDGIRTGTDLEEKEEGMCGQQNGMNGINMRKRRNHKLNLAINLQILKANLKIKMISELWTSRMS